MEGETKVGANGKRLGILYFHVRYGLADDFSGNVRIRIIRCDDDLNARLGGSTAKWLDYEGARAVFAPRDFADFVTLGIIEGEMAGGVGVGLGEGGGGGIRNME